MGLSTSLERALDAHPDWMYPVVNYEYEMESVSKRIAFLTKRQWSFPKTPAAPISAGDPPNAYECMTFLRQNGYRSPLLDWTLSPYVAAFFAFRHASIARSPEVAIYRLNAADLYMPQGDAAVIPIGNWIDTDQKHFLQQSWYTMSRRVYGSHLVYISHEQALKAHSGELLKYLLPASEARKAMEALRAMNIHPYALFDDLKSLLETVANDVAAMT